MEGQTKIIWDFTETAFRTGALDRILDLVQVLTGNSTQTLYDGLADLEDVFIEMEDTAPMEERLGRIYETLQALTDDDILDGIGTLLSVLTPAISMLAAQADGAPMTPEKQTEIKKKAGECLESLGCHRRYRFDRLSGRSGQQACQRTWPGCGKGREHDDSDRQWPYLQGPGRSVRVHGGPFRYG